MHRWHPRPLAAGPHPQACRAPVLRPWPVVPCPELLRNLWRRRQSARGVRPGTALTGRLPLSQLAVRRRARAVQRRWREPVARAMAVHFHRPVPARARPFPECKAAAHGPRRAEVCPVPPPAPWHRRRMVRRERPAMRPQEAAGNRAARLRVAVRPARWRVRVAHKGLHLLPRYMAGVHQAWA